MLWRSNTGDLLFHLRYPIKCVKFIRFSLKPPRLGLLIMQFCFSHIRHVYSPSFWYIESWIPVQNVWEAVPRKCSLKNVLLKYLQNLQEKTCVGVSFFNATLLKKRLQHRCFPLKFCKIFKNVFLKKHPRLLVPKFEVHLCETCVTLFLSAIFIRPQPFKLLIFLNFLGLKVA